MGFIEAKSVGLASFIDPTVGIKKFIFSFLVVKTGLNLHY
jgi:hypothetical protein